jgi:trypsin
MLPLLLLVSSVVEAAEDNREIQEIQEDIVGGTKATSRYRYYGISRRGDLCGATLIHSDIAVTAGHCKGVFINGGIFFGSTLLSGTDALESFDVSMEYRHPSYSSSTLKNDIMLIKLKGRSSITPISTNSQSSVPADNGTVRAIGFGRVSENGSLSRNLMQVDVKVLNSSVCKNMYARGGDPIYTDLQICASDTNKDACQGDSGG